jgi:hypothetical protein
VGASGKVLSCRNNVFTFAAEISDTGRFHVHGAIAETDHTPEQLDAILCEAAVPGPVQG